MRSLCGVLVICPVIIMRAGELCGSTFMPLDQLAGPKYLAPLRPAS